MADDGLPNNDGLPDGAVEDSQAGASEAAHTLRSMITTFVVLGATLMVLATVQPSLILRNNTPTGGDMGAHVWAPAYLRDVLLPNLRITGWSMDWYAGLPVYRFYMVVPAFFILLLDTVLPYGIAFKIVAVSGLVAFPAAAWAMGRVARLAYPLPELLAAGAVLFLYDESFTIYGGNLASTMAGEFSFSIALALAVLGLGLMARGLDDGRYRALTAVVISLSALCHGIVLIFVFLGAALMVVMKRDLQRMWFGFTTLSTAVLLSAFWVVPFLGNHAFMTDMKYEPRPSGGSDSLWQMYFPLSDTFNWLLALLAVAGFVGSLARRRFLGTWMGVYAIILMIGVKVAQGSLPVIGLLWNPRILPFFYLLRYMLAMIGVLEVWTFARQAVQTQRNPGSIPRPLHLNEASAVIASVALVCMVVLGVRYQSLPGARVESTSSGTSYVWGPLKFPSTRAFSDGWARWNFSGYEGKGAYGEYHDVVQTMKRLGENPGHGCGRALWENSGELNKYGTTMGLMLLPFWTDGCIGSMEGLYFEAAGTTPYHFVAAAALSKQSSNPVRELRYDNNDAARGVGYMRQLGIRYYMAFTPEAIESARGQEDLVEVASSGPWRVYEITDTAIVEPLVAEPVVVAERPGDQRERWLEVGMSWFQHGDEWGALPVASGPAGWQRTDVAVDVERRVGEPGDPGRQVDIVLPAAQVQSRALPQVKVSNVEVGEESVRFDVDRTGVPVLVKVSYFPNWRVKGATAIHRAAPNMMVVVPEANTVEMSYEPSGLDLSSYLLTFVGIALVVLFARRRFRYGTAVPPRRSVVEEDFEAPVASDIDGD
ncbi:MAG: 6-pyruvoyl-tetrahydropterin synthase-related protein [Acidimicrobiales bacterium]